MLKRSGAGHRQVDGFCAALQAHFVVTVFCLSALCGTGCGGGPKKPQGRVHGKVTYNGAPVPAGSQIAFVPVENGKGATAVTAADGSYQLATVEGDTIPVGQYQVSISAPPPTQGRSPEEAMKMSQAGGAETAATLPEKYLNPATSPENREVKEGDNEFNIELTD